MAVVAGSALRRGNIEEEVVNLWTTINGPCDFLNEQNRGLRSQG
jgi:hypothetical protein